MYIYFIIFILSTLFSFISEQLYKKDYKKISFAFSVIAIVIPCILAGIRASGIGTDTKVYVDGVFIYMANHVYNIQDLINYINNGVIEPLYMIVNFIVSRFTSNMNVMYFVLEALVIIPVYIGCRKLSKKLNVSSSVCYLIFLILFYNKSYNLCRQSIAMAFCFYSLDYVFERKTIKFLICILIAYLFHKSAIIFIPLYFIQILINIHNKKAKTILILSPFILLLSVLFFNNIVDFLINIGILSNKYTTFIHVYSVENNVKHIEILSESFVILVTIMFFTKLNKLNKYNNLILYGVIISFITFLFGYQAAFSQRISYYFSLFLVLMLPQIPKTFYGKKNRNIIMAIILFTLSFYSILYYGKYMFDQTVPYRIDTSEIKSRSR